MPSFGGQLTLRARSSPDERCPYCHDELAEGGVDFGREVTCESCGTSHHEACLAELGGCTALGCQGGKPPPQGSVEEVRARVRDRLNRFVRNNVRPAGGGAGAWNCYRCHVRLRSRTCVDCGHALDSGCEAPGHPCPGCGRLYLRPGLRAGASPPTPEEIAALWQPRESFFEGLTPLDWALLVLMAAGLVGIWSMVLTL